MIRFINKFLTDFLGIRITKVKKPKILETIKRWKPYDVGHKLIRVGGEANA
tara:strand:- start:583 stop:735 length:153 start_codon:yes stop_codon:yes gene_type:complete